MNQKGHLIPSFRTLNLGLIMLVLLMIGPVRQAFGFTIVDTVGDKFLVTGMSISATTPVVLKLKFENNTAGTNLSLCAGTAKDFLHGICATQLSSSGGPGFQFLTIVDTPQLSGLDVYVINNGPATPATFTLTIE